MNLIYLIRQNTILLMKFTIHKDWYPFFKKHKIHLKDIFKTIDFKQNILPKKQHIFRTFEPFGPSKCKLCILGQDPYPGSTTHELQKIYYAEGLAFSINPHIKKLPGSLRNIFKELKENYKDFTFQNGSLIRWVEEENIMLLNTALTVIEGKPNSHSKKWTQFTDEVIKELDENSNCLFLLMGGNAKKKIKLIKNKDRIITCVHPSPLSAYNGFFGSKVFTKINEKLKQFNYTQINWNT